MNLNRKRVLAGLAAAGMTVGTLAGGGVAVASTGSAHAPTATAPACGHMHEHGNWHGHSPVLKAVGGYLGLSDDKLRDQLESGKSLADIAKAQGKPLSGLKDTILGAVTKQINAATWINASQKAALITDVKGHLGDIVNATCTSAGSPSGAPSGSSSWSSGTPGGSASASVGGPRRPGPRSLRVALRGAHHPQDVAAGEGRAVGLGPAPPSELAEQGRVTGHVLQAGWQVGSAVEVAADANMR